MGYENTVVMGGDLIEEQVAEILKERGLTVSVAEACTSGLIAAKLTSVPGSSRFFVGGVLAYANDIKENVLGIPKEVMIREGSVSEVTAREMAKGARRLIGSDLAVSATGVMGPDGRDKGQAGRAILRSGGGGWDRRVCREAVFRRSG